MYTNYLIIISCIGFVCSQSEPSISDALDSLPPELQGKIDEGQINEIKNKTTKAFRELCEKNGGPDAYPRAEKAGEEFSSCLKQLVDVNLLQQEIENAKPTGQVDEVFKKYCEKTPSFKKCFRNMTDSIQPCLSPEEQANLKTVHNISEQLAEFICFKEGDRIALFIAEHGPECLQEKQDAIQDCVNKTLGASFKFDQTNLTSLSADSIPKLQFGEKECSQISELQTCVVEALETCEAPTSANIIESLFKFIRKATPCKDAETGAVTRSHKIDVKTPNAAIISANTMGLGLITSVLLALLV